MGFLLFFLVNFTLFLRPEEFLGELGDFRPYQFFIILCLLASFGQVIEQLTPKSLEGRPITCCVLLVLAAILLSHLARFKLYEVRTLGWDFSKVVLYYLLLVGLLNQTSRFRTYLVWFVAFMAVLAGLGLLQFHGFINIDKLERLDQIDTQIATGEAEVLHRLRSIGVMNDPNDFCAVLLVAITICCYFLTDRDLGLFRVLWLLPTSMFAYCVALTQSRGGFLALLAGSATWIVLQFGWRKAILVCAVILPTLFIAYSGRISRLSTAEDTARERFSLWSDALVYFKESPLFGIGQNEFQERNDLVVHNSYLHAFTELGFAGGTLFMGAFACAILILLRLRKGLSEVGDDPLQRFWPFAVTMVVAYATSLLSISRNYVFPTYLVLGLVTAYVSMAVPRSAPPVLRFSAGLVARLIFLSICFFFGTYGFLRLQAK